MIKKNGYNYTTFYELSTSENQDSDIANKFKEISENRPYNLVSGTNMDKIMHREGAVNCATVVNESLKAGRVPTGVFSNEIQGFTPALLMESIIGSNTTGVHYGQQTIIQNTKDFVNDKVRELKQKIRNLFSE